MRQDEIGERDERVKTGQNGERKKRKRKVVWVEKCEDTY